MAKKYCTECGAEKLYDNRTQYCRRCNCLHTLRARESYNPHPGHVYIAQQPGGGKVKIGFSVRLEQRIKVLGWEYNCKGIRLVAAIAVPNGEYELIVHRMFDDLRIETEFFTPSQRLYEFIHSDERWVIYNDLIPELLF